MTPFETIDVVYVLIDYGNPEIPRDAGGILAVCATMADGFRPTFGVFDSPALIPPPPE